MPSTKPTIIDLFCGCGGLGLGAELAGFHSLAAVDIDQDLQSAYRLNFPNTNVIQADIGLLDRRSWKEIIGDIRPDGIIGGPPCQGFSRIGRRQPNDPRNNLIGHFFRQINELQPYFFLMENVEGILDDGNREILDAGLATVPGNYKILGPVRINALDCGAATSRKRIVIIGFDPAYVGNIELHSLLEEIKHPPTTVREALIDLPPPTFEKSNSKNDYTWAKYPSRNLISDYAKHLRSLPPSGLGSQLAIDSLLLGKVSGLMGTKHTEVVVDRFLNTIQGKIEPVSRYPRLNLNGFCPTLRAGTGSDKGSYQAMRPIHPTEPRVITVREAARLQGFPDWFLFHPTIWHSFRMIGNSVSPIMSTQLLTAIRKKLERKLAA
ncbi:DNA cytosine methyltransferase [Pseudomonas sp. 6D_7.1_Bac1]|uniref:DNA cytosine methyltransferase n=1 Tax=Pseudomonas sp. 6D_7.1_Bac1 TaxID=2971615 RepID=UPI0021CA23C6|nr:DNA cytosine methyltransferase [Pseudomonas sp. 6D_7.1_Bac1]MCU1748370.1 DNA cytosine methyltransferase [Pseudomonas sp. 6D_7.1_Bac1]